MSSFWQSYLAGLASGVTLTILTYVITYFIKRKRGNVNPQSAATTGFTNSRLVRPVALMSFGLILIIISLIFPSASWLAVIAVMLLVWGGMGFMMT
jgi:hypothetical protein